VPEPRDQARLCVGIVTPGDVDGAKLTAQAIHLYHPEVAEHSSFVILDSRLEGAAAARDRCFREADADIVCCIDSYALLEPGALAAVLGFFDAHPGSRDPIEGAGYIACRRDAWQPSTTPSPFEFFDAIFCLNLDSETQRWADATRRHAQLGIAHRVERFPGVATPGNSHRGIAMAYRRMIAEAKRRGYEHLLVFEDDAVFLDDTLDIMRCVVVELADIEWDLCYLGACVWSQAFAPLAGSAVLQACGPVTCTHAVAFHRRAYERLLAEIPADADDLDRFIAAEVAIDQYLSRRIADGTYRAVITSPRVASQPNLLDWDQADAELGHRYVI
jgi:hypothetical protein